MEKFNRCKIEGYPTARIMSRAYTLLNIVEGLKEVKGIQTFEYKGATFKADHLASGICLVVRAMYRDMEEMGQRHFAWEIMEDIDSRHNLEESSK